MFQRDFIYRKKFFFGRKKIWKKIYIIAKFKRNILLNKISYFVFKKVFDSKKAFSLLYNKLHPDLLEIN